MTKISSRKTKLSFETDAEVRSWGSIGKRRRPVMCPVIVDVGNGFIGSVRLKGTKQRFEFSWHGLYAWATEIHSRREVEHRKQERAKRKGSSRF